MKALLAAACAALSLARLAFPLPQPASASDGRQYARADTRSVYFCSEMDPATARFAIPYTYCVEILADHGEWYLVRYAADDGFYAALTGYCQKEGLTSVDEPPQNVYLNFPVTATLRADVPQDGSLPGLEITVEAAYYGVYYKGAAAYSYVLYNDSFRYIPGANENYPLNDIPAEPAFSPEDGTDDGGGTAKLVTAVAITAIAAGAVLFLIFTGRQKPKQRQPKQRL